MTKKPQTPDLTITQRKVWGGFCPLNVMATKVTRIVTTRLLPQFVGHDAFDHWRIAVLFDEELSHSSL